MLTQEQIDNQINYCVQLATRAMIADIENKVIAIYQLKGEVNRLQNENNALKEAVNLKDKQTECQDQT